MLQTSVRGDPNLGLYGFATDRYALVGDAALRKALATELRVPVRIALIIDTALAGMFVAGNEQGMVVSQALPREDVHRLEAHHPVRAIATPFSALGNLILGNDHGAVVSPLLKKTRAALQEALGVPCVVGTVAKLAIVGTLGIATNKGCLLHPKTTKREMKTIEDVLGVQADVGTVSYGSPYPGAGVIANAHNFVAGSGTSGPELGRIAEALGFV